MSNSRPIENQSLKNEKKNMVPEANNCRVLHTVSDNNLLSTTRGATRTGVQTTELTLIFINNQL